MRLSWIGVFFLLAGCGKEFGVLSVDETAAPPVFDITGESDETPSGFEVSCGGDITASATFEDEGTSRWGISADEIAFPVTFGVLPGGAVEDDAPEALVSGEFCFAHARYDANSDGTTTKSPEEWQVVFQVP